MFLKQINGAIQMLWIIIIIIIMCAYDLQPNVTCQYSWALSLLVYIQQIIRQERTSVCFLSAVQRSKIRKVNLQAQGGISIIPKTVKVVIQNWRKNQGTMEKGKEEWMGRVTYLMRCHGNKGMEPKKVPTAAPSLIVMEFSLILMNPILVQREIIIAMTSFSSKMDEQRVWRRWNVKQVTKVTI